MSNLTSGSMRFVSSILNTKSDDPKLLMLKEYIRLFVLIVKRYPTLDCSSDDILSEAIIGFLEAIDKYDPERGDFKAYMLYVVRGRVYDYTLKNNRSVHIPFQINKTLTLLNKMYNKIENLQPQISPQATEILSTLENPPDIKINKDLKEFICKNKGYIVTIAKNSKTTYEKVIEKAEDLRRQQYLSLQFEAHSQLGTCRIDEESIDIKHSIEKILDGEEINEKKKEAYLLSLKGHSYGQIGRMVEPPLTRQGIRLRARAVRKVIESKVKK